MKFQANCSPRTLTFNAFFGVSSFFARTATGVSIPIAVTSTNGIAVHVISSPV